MIEKKTRKKLYQYDGENGFVEFIKTERGHGIGILFFYGEQGEAIRMNWEFSKSKSAEITSVDYWKNWDMSFPTPTFCLKGLRHLNSVALVEAIISFLDNFNVSDVFESHLDENDGILLEAGRRFGTEEFSAMAIDHFGSSIIKYVELKQWAKDNNYSIPTVIRKSKTSPGKAGSKDLSPFLDGNPVEVIPGVKEIAVSSDKEKKVISTLEKKIQKVPVKELFEDLEDLVEMIISGDRPSLIISGSGGVGKTASVLGKVKEHNLRKNKDYVKVSGKVSPFGLYSQLFLGRHKNFLTILDDSDSVFNNDICSGLLKNSLDSYDTRVVSWKSKTTINLDDLDPYEQNLRFDEIERDLKNGEESVRLPSSFDFEGKVIFISNLPAERIPQPIRSRSLFIDITLNRDELLERIEMILPDMEPGMKMGEKLEVLEELKVISANGQIQNPTLRMMVGALSIRKSGNPKWKRLLKYSSQ